MEKRHITWEYFPRTSGAFDLSVPNGTDISLFNTVVIRGGRGTDKTIGHGLRSPSNQGVEGAFTCLWQTVHFVMQPLPNSPWFGNFSAQVQGSLAQTDCSGPIS